MIVFAPWRKDWRNLWNHDSSATSLGLFIVSFKEIITRHPEAADQITDCLSGDVNKDFSQLWSWIREFVPLPEDLPYGEPLVE